MKYFVDYEALVYNMPECNGFEFLDHQFIAHPITAEDEKFIVPNNDILKANFSFQACCLTYSNNHSSYITALNKTPLEIACDNMSDDELHDKADKMVRKRIEDMEQHLILTTNLHIFFPVVKINIRSEDGQKSLLCGFMNNRPMPVGKWIWLVENINLECRLHFHLDKTSFDKFRLHKSRTRYNRAFDYYIRSFYEFDHSSAFCILCSALDAITGCSNSNKTKERLAKYSSVLFCTPLEMEQLKSKMQRLYELRSDFTHGKGSKITVQDEIELREYVRKFLLAYFLFWQEMKIKNEPQMLQKLDEILEDHSLYIKYAPAAYEFVRLTEEHEKQPRGIIQKSMPEKYALAVVKMLEALIKLPAPPSSEDTAQGRREQQPMSIQQKSSIELMNIYAEILAELNRRNVVRTYNSPVGDYAEWLVAEKLGFVLERNAQKGYDALDPKTGLRYQVKSRWERGAASAQSRELNVIRNYDDNQFDYLIIVIFDEHFGVKEAYMLPHDTVKPYARYNKHQNGYILIAKGAVLTDKDIKNITLQLR